MAENSGKHAERSEKPLISVVMPCYNGEKTLPAALDSALAQAKDVPLEIIVIDDGSSDGTGKIIDAYASGKTEWEGHEGGPPAALRVIRHEKSRGAAAGRNEGVAAARGKYVAFLDADDIWAEGKLKAQTELMELRAKVRGRGAEGTAGTDPSGRAGAHRKPRKARRKRRPEYSEGWRPPLCCTARELMTPDGVLTGRVIPVKERISYRELLKHNSINCSSVLIRTRIAREFPMEHEDSHEDYITWLKVVRKYGPAAGINRPFLKYRLSNAGKSGSKLKSARMTYAAYRYAGFGPAMAAVHFVSYAVHGVWKYWRA